MRSTASGYERSCSWSMCIVAVCGQADLQAVAGLGWGILCAVVGGPRTPRHSGGTRGGSGREATRLPKTGPVLDIFSSHGPIKILEPTHQSIRSKNHKILSMRLQGSIVWV